MTWYQLCDVVTVQMRYIVVPAGRRYDVVTARKDHSVVTAGDCGSSSIHSASARRGSRLGAPPPRDRSTFFVEGGREGGGGRGVLKSYMAVVF